MPTSGGAGNGPVFGRPQGITFGGAPAGGEVDKTYVFTFDARGLTWGLIAIGYRPYYLTRKDSGLRQVVWATSPDLSRYAAGDVVALPIDGYTVTRTVVILVDEQDGGTINEHGIVLARKVLV